MKKYIVIDVDENEWIVLADEVHCDVRGILTFSVGKSISQAFNAHHWLSVKQIDLEKND